MLYEVVGPFTFSFIGVKGLIQSPLFLENFISSDYDTLAVQRESEKRRRKIREDHLQDFWYSVNKMTSKVQSE